MDGVEVIRYRYAPERLQTLVTNGGIVTNLRNHRWKLLLVPGFILMQAWQAWQLCRKHKIASVHAHWLIPQGLIAAMLQRLPGSKPTFVVTSHGADLYALRSRPLQAIKRMVLRQAHSCTVVSSAMRAAVEQLGGDTGKVSVVPMGVDMAERFVPGNAALRSRNELLFVGRLVEKKGLSFLLDAFPALLQVRPDLHLTIAGFGPDESQLKRQVTELGLQHSVRFLGAVAQKDLPQLYQSAALFVAPFVRAESGDQEGLPVALMEAVACGCPAVAGNVEGLQDIFGMHAQECMVDPHDSGALTAAILARLQAPENAARQALAMRAALLEQLGWEHVAARYSQLLKQACH
ncbi:Glycosyltransferase involved in cell wall bisynthesis [Delftia lacustris]|uniref:Glycosyltransferase involved in cell wall bisynthesis n=2 Tax=Delftia lacustris TaxID=558537 RepID=A0A1H3F935_9BURK|nr:Glycosyltransferase involved in cell wall bisynthesis [Delftia lacustris]